MPVESHPDFQIIKFVIHIHDGEDVEVPVKGADLIHFQLPGGIKYHMTLHFQVKNRRYENVKYIQVVKKAGITIRTTEYEIGSYDPSEEVYTKDFPESDTPGGWLTRGNYQNVSTYYEGDEVLIATPWTLELVAKK
ncbi:Rho GDP-dissociation inhibitor [Candida viswanathii]|uniref:Rho GDP-dissociation inhibitor n=1 Tax=Candida viswanathii TaxID=5486 RepID=A0A367YGJ5_9ASCO|nr:Rho GDP-dissociation inhibitor [Candida viswanathii]